MARRAFGQIDKLPSGKFRARYTGPDRALHKAPNTFYDKTDAATWLRNEQKLIAFNEWTPPATRFALKASRGITVGEWMEKWLTIKEAEELKPSTMQTYRTGVQRRITGVKGETGKLAKMPLAAVTKGDVMAWWDALILEYGNQETNHKARKYLRGAFTYAVDRGLIETNPAVEMKVRKQSPTRKALPDYAVMLGTVAQLPEKYRLVGILTFFHGLRIGEALSLHRRDADLDKGVIHVHANVYREHGAGMLRQETTKTEAGNRDMTILDRFRQDFEMHLRYHVGDSPNAPLFSKVRGGGYLMDTTYRTALATAKKKAGYEGVPLAPHHGRVWLITELAENGLTPPAIGELLGQTDLTTIVQVYMRTSEKLKRDAVSSLNRKLG